MNRYVYLLLGLIGGIALGFGLGRAYGIRTAQQIAERNRQRYEAMGPRVAAVAAARDIPAGATLTDLDLGTLSVFSSTVRSAVRPEEAQLILGRKVLFNIEARRPILWSDIEGGKEGDNQQQDRDSGARAKDGTSSGLTQPQRRKESP